MDWLKRRMSGDRDQEVPEQGQNAAALKVAELLEIQPGDVSFRYSQKAGCSCGCSPGYFIYAKLPAAEAGRFRWLGSPSKDNYQGIEIWTKGNSVDVIYFNKEGISERKEPIRKTPGSDKPEVYIKDGKFYVRDFKDGEYVWYRADTKDQALSLYMGIHQPWDAEYAEREFQKELYWAL